MPTSSSPAPREAVTRILNAAIEGDLSAAAELLPLVYEELRQLAAARRSNDRAGKTLQPTALVHEAYLRLVGPTGEHFNGRAHFLGAAAEAMRRILIERARRRLAEKHGGGIEPHPLDHDPPAVEAESRNVLSIHEALTTFEQVDPDKAALVKLRYFAGLTEDQAAQALGISRATAARHWVFARAWLYDEVTRRQRDPR